MAEHTSPKINHFYSSFSFIFKENIFRFKIRMDNIIFFKEGKSSQYLNGKSSNVVHLDRLEIIQMHKFIETDTKKLGNNADMFPEDNEIFDSYNVLLILDILLFDSHQNINFIQG